MEYSGYVCSPRIPHGCIYLRRAKTWKGGGRCSLYLRTLNWFGICDDEWLLGEELHCKWSMLQRHMNFQCLPGSIWLNYLSRRLFYVYYREQNNNKNNKKKTSKCAFCCWSFLYDWRGSFPGRWLRWLRRIQSGIKENEHRVAELQEQSNVRTDTC